MTARWPDFGIASASLAAAWDAIKARFTELVSGWSSGEPALADRFVGMRWYDPATKTNKYWDGSLWQVDQAAISGMVESRFFDLVSSAQPGLMLVRVPSNATVQRVELLTIVGNTGNGTDEISLNLTNATQTLELFSTNPDSTADPIPTQAEWTQTPDQNLDVDQNDILQVGLTASGAAVLATTRIRLVMTPR